MSIAKKEEILKKIESLDLNDLLDRMEDYVRTRFYNKSEKEREGFDYLDFCYNVIVKASTGVRNWDKEKTSFEEFIFGALKSDLYNFFRKHKDKKKSKRVESIQQETYLIEIYDFIELSELQANEEPSYIDFTEISQNAIDSLKEQGADKLEIAVFECWLADYYKPKEIAELCNVTTTEINNTVKRLSRKTVKLKEKWKSLKN